MGAELAVEEFLSAALKMWQVAHGLPHESADEQLVSGKVNEDQRRWLETFCRLWDLTTE